MLIDTDVIIWYMRGYGRAREAIIALEHRSISIVTQMELVQGLRNRAEQRALHRFLDQRQFMVYPVSEKISQCALFLMEEWRLSHHMLMADALIAATAVEYGLPLLTANIKHYEFLPSLTLERFRP
jgi:predicted nucleic acid-binding protein